MFVILTMFLWEADGARSYNSTRCHTQEQESAQDERQCHWEKFGLKQLFTQMCSIITDILNTQKLLRVFFFLSRPLFLNSISKPRFSFCYIMHAPLSHHTPVYVQLQ